MTVYCRNDSYFAHMQLAVLGHNEHIEREVADNRKYRKQTKKWDLSLLKCDKDYKYIPDLMHMVCKERRMSNHGLKCKRAMQQEHPANIQSTIADKTSNLVKKKNVHG